MEKENATRAFERNGRARLAKGTWLLFHACWEDKRVQNCNLFALSMGWIYNEAKVTEPIPCQSFAENLHVFYIVLIAIVALLLSSGERIQQTQFFLVVILVHYITTNVNTLDGAHNGKITSYTISYADTSSTTQHKRVREQLWICGLSHFPHSWIMKLFAFCVIHSNVFINDVKSRGKSTSQIIRIGCCNWASWFQNNAEQLTAVLLKENGQWPNLSGHSW